MGLLDGLNTDDGRLGLALLAAAGPQAQPMSFGQRLAGAMGQHQAGLDKRREQQAQEEERRQRAQMMMLQVEQIKRAQAQQDAERDRASRIEGAYRGAFESPVDQALAGGGGPTVANAQAMDKAVPRINQQKLIQGLMAEDPMTAFKMAQPKEEEAYTLAPGAARFKGQTRLADNPVQQKKDIGAMIVEGPDGQPMINPLWVAAKKATQAPGTVVNVGTGQKDANWGTPPKDYVWARDAAGNVMTERDPASGAFRPIAAPVGGADRAQQQNSGIATMADTLALLDKAIKHPGRETATGVSGQIDPRNYVAGTEATNFKVLLDQIGGKAFLQAFESLKGGGQITEVEGRKATDAIARLNRAQSDNEFMQALQDFRDVVAGAYKRSTGVEYKLRAPPVDTSLGAPSDIADIMNQYGRRK